eukprot:Clim_evm90s108 gene=Clim_evmTU90s108
MAQMPARVSLASLPSELPGSQRSSVILPGRFGAEVSKLYATKQFADLCFVDDASNPGKTRTGHRMVLAAHSVQFEDLFRQLVDRDEEGRLRVRLSDLHVTGEALDKALEWMYTGVFTFTDTEKAKRAFILSKLLVFCTQFEIEKLGELCEQWIEQLARGPSSIMSSVEVENIMTNSPKVVTPASIKGKEAQRIEEEASQDPIYELESETIPISMVKCPPRRASRAYSDAHPTPEPMKMRKKNASLTNIAALFGRRKSGEKSPRISSGSSSLDHSSAQDSAHQTKNQKSKLARMMLFRNTSVATTDAPTSAPPLHTDTSEPFYDEVSKESDAVSLRVAASKGPETKVVQALKARNRAATLGAAPRDSRTSKQSTMDAEKVSMGRKTSKLALHPPKKGMEREMSAPMPQTQTKGSGWKRLRSATMSAKASERDLADAPEPTELASLVRNVMHKRGSSKLVLAKPEASKSSKDIKIPRPLAETMEKQSVVSMSPSIKAKMTKSRFKAPGPTPIDLLVQYPQEVYHSPISVSPQYLSVLTNEGIKDEKIAKTIAQSSRQLEIKCKVEIEGIVVKPAERCLTWEEFCSGVQLQFQLSNGQLDAHSQQEKGPQREVRSGRVNFFFRGLVLFSQASVEVFVKPPRPVAAYALINEVRSTPHVYPKVYVCHSMQDHLLSHELIRLQPPAGFQIHHTAQVPTKYTNIAETIPQLQSASCFQLCWSRNAQKDHMVKTQMEYYGLIARQIEDASYEKDIGPTRTKPAFVFTCDSPSLLSIPESMTHWYQGHLESYMSLQQSREILDLQLAHYYFRTSHHARPASIEKKDLAAFTVPGATVAGQCSTLFRSLWMCVLPEHQRRQIPTSMLILPTLPSWRKMSSKVDSKDEDTTAMMAELSRASQAMLNMVTDTNGDDLIENKEYELNFRIHFVCEAHPSHCAPGFGYPMLLTATEMRPLLLLSAATLYLLLHSTAAYSGSLDLPHNIRDEWLRELSTTLQKHLHIDFEDLQEAVMEQLVERIELDLDSINESLFKLQQRYAMVASPQDLWQNNIIRAKPSNADDIVFLCRSHFNERLVQEYSTEVSAMHADLVNQGLRATTQRNLGPGALSTLNAAPDGSQQPAGANIEVLSDALTKMSRTDFLSPLMSSLQEMREENQTVLEALRTLQQSSSPELKRKSKTKLTDIGVGSELARLSLAEQLSAMEASKSMSPAHVSVASGLCAKEDLHSSLDKEPNKSSGSGHQGTSESIQHEDNMDEDAFEESHLHIEDAAATLSHFSHVLDDSASEGATAKDLLPSRTRHSGGIDDQITEESEAIQQEVVDAQSLSTPQKVQVGPTMPISSSGFDHPDFVRHVDPTDEDRESGRGSFSHEDETYLRVHGLDTADAPGAAEKTPQRPEQEVEADLGKFHTPAMLLRQPGKTEVVSAEREAEEVDEAEHRGSDELERMVGMLRVGEAKIPSSDLSEKGESMSESGALPRKESMSLPTLPLTREQSNPVSYVPNRRSPVVMPVQVLESENNRPRRSSPPPTIMEDEGASTIVDDRSARASMDIESQGGETVTPQDDQTMDAVDKELDPVGELLELNEEDVTLTEANGVNMPPMPTDNMDVTDSADVEPSSAEGVRTASNEIRSPTPLPRENNSADDEEIEEVPSSPPGSTQPPALRQLSFSESTAVSTGGLVSPGRTAGLSRFAVQVLPRHPAATPDMDVVEHREESDAQDMLEHEAEHEGPGPMSEDSRPTIYDTDEEHFANAAHEDEGDEDERTLAHEQGDEEEEGSTVRAEEEIQGVAAAATVAMEHEGDDAHEDERETPTPLGESVESPAGFRLSLEQIAQVHNQQEEPTSEEDVEDDNEDDSETDGEEQPTGPPPAPRGGGRFRFSFSLPVEDLPDNEDSEHSSSEEHLTKG